MYYDFDDLKFQLHAKQSVLKRLEDDIHLATELFYSTKRSESDAAKFEASLSPKRARLRFLEMEVKEIERRIREF